jgi:hypothetical protein
MSATPDNELDPEQEARFRKAEEHLRSTQPESRDSRFDGVSPIDGRDPNRMIKARRGREPQHSSLETRERYRYDLFRAMGELLVNDTCSLPFL